MKIVRASVTPIRRRLRQPILTGAGSIEVRDGLLLEIHDADGHCGLGEAAPLPHMGTESFEACQRTLRSSVERIVAGTVTDSGPIDGELQLAPAARAAVESALVDLRARRRGVPLVRFLADELGTVPRRSVECSVLLSGSDPDSITREGGERYLDGFRTFKLKVGASATECDESRLRALRDAVGRSARIRLDANGSWKPNEALRLLDRWAHYEIEFIEQPVPAHDLDGLRRVRERSAVAVAADEALLATGALQRVLTEHAADIVVLKPTLLGGPATTAGIAYAARRQGLDVVVTSALEGAVGVTAAAHLAASLPESSRPAGLATADRLLGDVACGPSTRMGRLIIGSAAGLGLVIEPGRRLAAASGPTWEVRAA